MSIYPRPLIGPDGRADHGTLMLLIWAMIAGLVRGVGFIPRNRVLHVLLSAPAAYAAFLAACLMLYFTHAPV
ncbi:MAG: hypothetical protein H6865_08510 [Rhodospirillales bacterium]|nr:hypothetical protein [Alphaproteobacteria bacterium]MCB9987657.1 hypothetical protein [Rhodospirillales bacterium]USO08044.1 MAG: hypothetical protein H6866_02165 [Rhodospirillales bacterium]